MNGHSIYNKQAIIHLTNIFSDSPTEFINSGFFKSILVKFLDELRKRGSKYLHIFPNYLTNQQQNESIHQLLLLLNAKNKQQIIEQYPQYRDYFNDLYLLHQFVEQFYNFWRSLERYVICYEDQDNPIKYEHRPYRTFNDTIDKINDLKRRIYRDICENITNQHPRIYRQVAAGAGVGIITTAKFKLNLPPPYDKLDNIPTIRQVLIEPPLIINSPANKRMGKFRKIDRNPLCDININKDHWLCYPAKVGDLTILLYFHHKFIGLGTATANLFELEEDEQKIQSPAAIYLYGTEENLQVYGPTPTVFFEDQTNHLLVGAVPGDDVYGYFGYIKKMMLTLHNIICLKKGRLPVHGAMMKIELKNEKTANIVIIGDSGTGKSETLEAFRMMGQEQIRDLTIIFDDMGSLSLADGQLKAYGTETGAFVRLDDLNPGFAFGNIDRSIIINPHQINARAIIPVTTMEEILRGHNIDMLMYANNYEQPSEDRPIIEKFTSVEQALYTFKEGKRIAKGTTTENGLVGTYFANIFGPTQYQDLHDQIVNKYFDFLFANNIPVCQLRTQLGINGQTKTGPEAAAKALLEMIG